MNITKDFGLFLSTSPITVLLLTFSLPSIFAGLVVVEFMISSGQFDFWFNLLQLIIVISYLPLIYELGKIMPKIRDPISHKISLQVLWPRLLVTGLILVLVLIENYGLRTFLLTSIFDLAEIPIDRGLKLAASFFETMMVPALSFYWYLLVKNKEKSRQSLLTNKYRC